MFNDHAVLNIPNPSVKSSAAHTFHTLMESTAMDMSSYIKADDQLIDVHKFL